VIEGEGDENSECKK